MHLSALLLTSASRGEVLRLDTLVGGGGMTEGNNLGTGSLNVKALGKKKKFLVKIFY